QHREEREGRGPQSRCLADDDERERNARKAAPREHSPHEQREGKRRQEREDRTDTELPRTREGREVGEARVRAGLDERPDERGEAQRDDDRARETPRADGDRKSVV